MSFASERALARRAGALATAVAGIGFIGAMLVAAGAAQAQTVSLDALLGRIAIYLQDYETKAFELVAEEEYSQWIRRRPGYGQETVARRKLKSTYFLIRLPDGQAWYGFRDVTSVDGRVVPAARRSMADLLSERTVDAVEEALAITRANAKYNIGDVIRTINVPLQALALLVPEHQKRFEFREAGREKVKGQEAAVVAFQERSSPTLISDGFGGDVFSRGRIWVDPTTGAALRTELSFGGPATAYLKENMIRVDYERDSRLQLMVPREMEETYGLDVEVVHGRASYRNFRRFETGGRLVTQPE